MKLRKSVAALAVAGAAVFVAAGCSSSTDSVDEVTSQASTAIESAADKVTDAVSGLDADGAQKTLRIAVDPNTTSEDLDKAVDTTNPVTKAALQGFAKASNAAGYTPEVYTVKEVKGDGDNKATATVAVKSPHAPQPVDIQLSYVKIDGDWKLSGDAVTQLGSMGGQHGG
ncbi:hypothetical protein [Gordonia soli]|uniref:Low molecular weight antigen MTB12-like C-terminal domain-containing protein n=1 Tax=Gordonia soli NBRC 108243 TaxID=1223545 RepID=M0QD77_9ACTN|nr:hypothetical protein [Gordonia soli]GAC66286.1 hypothetical protein GS4_01_00880 [Gordonia soli NBRC 108243]